MTQPRDRSALNRGEDAHAEREGEEMSALGHDSQQRMALNPFLVPSSSNPSQPTLPRRRLRDRPASANSVQWQPDTLAESSVDTDMDSVVKPNRAQRRILPLSEPNRTVGTPLGIEDDNNPPEGEADVASAFFEGGGASREAARDHAAARRSPATLFQRLALVQLRWRAHSLLLLACFVVASVVYIGIDGRSMRHLARARHTAARTLDVADVAVVTSAACVRAAFSSPATSLPSSVADLLLALRVKLLSYDRQRSRYSQSTTLLTSYVDGALASASALRCRSALREMSDLFTALTLEVNYISSRSPGISTDNFVNVYPSAWSLLTNQLYSDGLLRVREVPPVESQRVLEGVAHNFDYTDLPFADFTAALLPLIGDVMKADNATLAALLAAVPVLEPHQLDLLPMRNMFSYLAQNWSSNAAGGLSHADRHNITHCVLHACVVVVGCVGAWLLLSVAARRHKEEQTATIVRRDFRLVYGHHGHGGEHASADGSPTGGDWDHDIFTRAGREEVVMTARSLRLMDYYCWRVRVMQPVNGDTTEEVRAGGADSLAYRYSSVRTNAMSMTAAGSGRSFTQSRKDSAGAAKRNWISSLSTAVDATEVPLNESQPLGSPSLAASLSINHGVATASSSTVELPRSGFQANASQLANPLAAELAPPTVLSCGVGLTSVDSVNYNEWLRSQVERRVALLRGYAEEYAALADATQIELYLHQLVHPMLLLRPFVPSYILRTLRLPASESAGLGPSAASSRSAVGIVMRDGLEDSHAVDGVVAAAGARKARRSLLGKGKSRSRSVSTSMAAKIDATAEETDSRRDATTAYLYVSFRLFNSSEALRQAERHYHHADHAAASRGRGHGAHHGSAGELAADTVVMEAAVPLEHTTSTAHPTRTLAPAYSTNEAENSSTGSAAARAAAADADEEEFSKVAATAVAVQNTSKRVGGRLTAGEWDGVDSGPLGSGRPAKARGGSGSSRSSPATVPAPFSFASAKPGRAYPLSTLAAAINLTLCIIHEAEAAYGGEVVQVASDGVLLQFRSDWVTQQEKVHCFTEADRRRAETAAVCRGSRPSRVGGDCGTKDDDRDADEENKAAPTLGMRVEERAARAAVAIQRSIRAYGESPENTLVPPELLRCAQLILSDESNSAACASSWVPQSSPSKTSHGPGALTISVGEAGGAGEQGSTNYRHGSSREGHGDADDAAHRAVADPATTGSLRGLVEFHVTKHYCVLSRCMPLIFSIEQLALEHGGDGIFMTRAVQTNLASVCVSTPVDFLDVPDLNLYYYRQAVTKTTPALIAATTAGSPTLPPSTSLAASTRSESETPRPSSASRKSPEDAASPPGAAAGQLPTQEPPSSRPHSRSGVEDAAAPAARGTAVDAPENQAAPSPPSATVAGGAAENDRRLPFAATGTVYVLESMAPADSGSYLYAEYVDQRDHTEARRQHWRSIWSKYESILRRRPYIRALRVYLDRRMGPASGYARSRLTGELDAKHGGRSGSQGARSAQSSPPPPGADGEEAGSSTGGSNVVLLVEHEDTTRGLVAQALTTRRLRTTPVASAGTGSANSYSGSNVPLRQVGRTVFSPSAARDGGDGSSPSTGEGTSGAHGAGSTDRSSRRADGTVIPALLASLDECLTELVAYRHEYGNMSREEKYTFGCVEDDVVGMLLALGVRESDLAW